MTKVIFEFKELTDLTLSIDYSKGDNIGEFKSGEVCRELFIIYKGPEFENNKEEFFKSLNNWLRTQPAPGSSEPQKNKSP